jgi:hypothetical protein
VSIHPESAKAVKMGRHVPTGRDSDDESSLFEGRTETIAHHFFLDIPLRWIVNFDTVRLIAPQRDKGTTGNQP